MSLFYYAICSFIAYFTSYQLFLISGLFSTITNALISLAISVFIVIIMAILQELKYRRIMSLWTSKNSIINFIDCGELILKKSRNAVLISKLAVNLCNAYMQIGEYKKAMTALQKAYKDVSISSFNKNPFLPKKFKMIYYNNLINLYLIDEKISLADATFVSGGRFLLEYVSDSEFGIGVLHTLSLLELRKGNFTTAQSYLDAAVIQNPNHNQKMELAFVKSQIFLMTGKIDEGVDLLNLICDNDPEQSLKRQIEDFWSKITTNSKV